MASAPVRSMTKKSRRSPGPATVGGGSPALTACAARTMSERAAWRKMSVRRTTGTRVRLDQVVEHAAGADRRELVDVAHQQHVRARADGAEERLGQAHRQHRGLVDDEHVGAGDRVLGAAREALVGGVLEQSVDRRRRRARDLGQPPRRLAGGRAQAHRAPLGVQEVDERAHGHRLAGARAAGEDRQPALEDGAHHRPLGVGGGEVARSGARSRPGAGAARRR